MAERLGAILAGPRHPLTHRGFAHAHGLGDLVLRPAVLLELPGW
jgi:hypothetical protein